MPNQKRVSPFSAAAIEQICEILGDALLGSQINGLIAPLKVEESPYDRQGTKWKRLFSAVATAQNRTKDGRPLVRLVIQGMSPARFKSNEEFEALRAALNERLLLCGLEVSPKAQVVWATKAETLNEAIERARSLVNRNVHNRVMDFCRTELLEDNYYRPSLRRAGA